MKHLKFLTMLVALVCGTIAFGQDDEKAKVYVIRNSPANPLMSTTVMINGNAIGTNIAMRYVESNVTEGNITISAGSKGSKTLNLDVKAGETYYIQQKIMPSPFPGVVMCKFQEFKPGKGEKALKRCKRTGGPASTM